jgi:hypothetical protein
MRKRQKRWATAGAAVLIVSATAVLLRHRHHRDASSEEAEASDPVRVADRWRGFASGTDVPQPPRGDAGATTPDWFSSKVTPDQVDGAMEEWRRGILEKRSELVHSLDQAFSMLPGRYGPALVKLAEADSDERVRAFSTRVLGKMKNAALVEDFQRLLADKSPFVRQNAAWALGELAARPGGREAAEAALDELRQAQDDPATEVRAAATNTLKALQ